MVIMSVKKAFKVCLLDDGKRTDVHGCYMVIKDKKPDVAFGLHKDGLLIAEDGFGDERPIGHEKTGDFIFHNQLSILMPPWTGAQKALGVPPLSVSKAYLTEVDVPELGPAEVVA